MHFVDRTLYPNPPLAILAAYHAEEQPKWVAYKAWLKIMPRTVPAIAKPSGKWTNTDSRDPLRTLFNNNCGYCGIDADHENDGEVDHFFPKELDDKADHIYSWENYVWACHSCNNKKRNNHPLIDPCSKIETSQIDFQYLDGRYILKPGTPPDIKDKFVLTEQKTFMNGKKRPQKRKLIFDSLTTIYLDNLKNRQKDYDLELTKSSTSVNTVDALAKLNEAKSAMRVFVATGDFILLKKHIFSNYKRDFPDFNFEYSDFE